MLHLLHIFTQTALKGFIVLSSFIKMVLVHVIELENIFLKVKIVTKETQSPFSIYFSLKSIVTLHP